MDCVLTAVDTGAIQRYIFGTNRLREHVGASESVLQATTRWVWETLHDSGLRVNVGRDGTRDNRRSLEGGGLDAEVIYTAGGNAVLLFTGDDQTPAVARARSWARMLSRRALKEAPGLALWVAHSDVFVWDAGGADLAGRLRDVFERLDQHKRTSQTSTPITSLGVTATCQSTGLAAVAMDEVDPIRVSREVLSKTAARDDARRRFDELLRDFKRLGVRLPDQLDELNPDKGERSYIAVVHADGNGIGDRFKAVWRGSANREAIHAIRTLSEHVHAAGQEALRQALSMLITPDGLIPPYTAKTFPVRPLIYGGDDVTFVCDGRIGLGLAASYLAAFERIATERLGSRTTASAGVAIVKTHYPFSRAYELAEELIKSAKQLSKQGADGPYSTLDWHIATSGVLEDLGDVRAREYEVPDGRLTMRPVYLRAAAGVPQEQSWRTWANVEEVISRFQTDSEWSGKRNKIKQLREVLREGSQRVDQFRALYQSAELPGYGGVTDLKERGWLGRRSGYFDPIEALDLYVPAERARQWLTDEVAR